MGEQQKDIDRRTKEPMKVLIKNLIDDIDDLQKEILRAYTKPETYAERINCHRFVDYSGDAKYSLITLLSLVEESEGK